MQSIALFLPNWIGDVVMATPAIRAVREHYPQARLVAVARPYVADVLNGAPWFDRIILAGKEVFAPARQLKSERIDAAVLFPNSFRSALIAWLGGCRQRVGFARYGRSMLLTDRLDPVRDERGRIIPSPIINDYNRLIAPLGITNTTHRMELFTTPVGESAAAAVWTKFGLDQQEVIGLNPGAAFGAAKFWPITHFARLARMLTDRRGARVLVLCGPKERELAQQIVQASERSTVTSIADEPLSLDLTKAIVRRLDLLITTDSGPRHFAAAFGRPVVSLFGPTFIEWTDTFYSHEIHLQKKVPCGPCQQRICPTDHRCMRELLPDEVYEACEQLRTRIPLPLRGRHAS